MLSDVVVTGAAGAVFGLALAAPPGPMNAVIAEESVLRGWSAGVRAGLGAMVADLAFFGLSLAGVVTVVARRPALRALLFGIGGCLMLYFAVSTARTVRSVLDGDTGDDGQRDADPTSPAGDTAGPDDRSVHGTGRGFPKALALALTNPYQILFWLTAGVGLLSPGRYDLLRAAAGDRFSEILVVETGSPALLVGLFAGIGLWVVGFPAGLVAAGQQVDRLRPAVAAGSALVLAGFGAAFLWTALAAL